MAISFLLASTHLTETVRDFSEATDILKSVGPGIAKTAVFTDLDGTICSGNYREGSFLSEDSDAFIDFCVENKAPLFILTANSFIQHNLGQHDIFGKEFSEKIRTTLPAAWPSHVQKPTDQRFYFCDNLVSAGREPLCTKGCAACFITKQLKDKQLMVFLDDREEFTEEFDKTARQEDMSSISLTFNPYSIPSTPRPFDRADMLASIPKTQSFDMDVPLTKSLTLERISSQSSIESQTPQKLKLASIKRSVSSLFASMSLREKGLPEDTQLRVKAFVSTVFPTE